MQAPHNWTVWAMWSQHQGGDGSQAQFSAASLCDPYPASLRRHVSQSPSLMMINWTQETIQVFVWQRVMQQSNVNRLQPHQSTSDHFPDATNKGNIPCWWLTQWQQKLSQASCWEMPAGIDTSLRVSFWDFCGLALCQNRILFKLKIYWFKFRKTLLCCFYNQIRGWGNFDLYFFFSFMPPYMGLRRCYI